MNCIGGVLQSGFRVFAKALLLIGGAMSNSDAAKIAEVAATVMNALQPLTSEERLRVICSAAALFGVSVAQAEPLQQLNPNLGEKKGSHQSQGSVAAGTSGKQTSLVEFLKEKNPATNAQRIACFAYYREKYEKVAHFASVDLAGYFAKAKLAPPGPNYAREYNKAVKEAWIHDDGANSYLTQQGESRVEVGFDGKRQPPNTSISKKKKKAGKGE